MKLLAIGDSISYGWGVNREKESYLALLANKMTAEGKEFSISNHGIPGNTILAGWESREKSLEKFQPDYIIINFGTNDGLPSIWGHQVQVSLLDFRKKLTDLVQFYQEKTVAQIILFSTTFSREKFIQESFYFYNEEIEKVAKEKRIDLVNIYTLLAEQKETLLGDGLHPNVLGHQLIFHSLNSCLGKNRQK